MSCSTFSPSFAPGTEQERITFHLTRHVIQWSHDSPHYASLRVAQRAPAGDHVWQTGHDLLSLFQSLSLSLSVNRGEHVTATQHSEV